MEHTEESQLQRKRAAAQQRQEEHAAWKRAFFQTRPPPPSIGRLHRRQREITKGHSCHHAFNAALALVKQQDEEETTVNSNLNAPLSALGVLTTSAASTTVCKLSKHEAWVAQLHDENERRRPSTDINIRSDPLRTVIMANLHPETVEEDLRHFADQFGRVVNVRIVRHNKTGKSCRYAFVEFNLVGEARKATQFHRKKRLKGYSIVIDREKGRTEAGFLPKRLATASSFWTSTAEGMVPVTATEGVDAVSPDASALGAGRVQSMLRMPENDDDFLNSILNS